MASSDLPPPEWEQRFNDVLAEYLDALEAGQPEDRAALLERHPDLADDLRAFFARAEQVQGLAAPLRATAGTGSSSADAAAESAQRSFPSLPADQFRIVREVGRGGMGVVYEAVDLSLGRRVALKVLRREDQADPRALERFRREARIVARLHHTNIVPIFQVGACEGLHYFTMEFIDGRGLDRVLHELRQPPSTVNARADGTRPLTSPPGSASPALGGNDQDSAAGSISDRTGTLSHDRYRFVARLGVDVAEALAHAHEHGVLHRDIKPSNLLLDRQGTVWVTDFGLAKEGQDAFTAPGEVVGTLRYLAPERFSGRIDERGEVYSVGATLYELLTLRPVHDESDRARLMARVLHEEPVRPRQLDRRLPRDLETIVLKALAKDPARRYPTAQAMADDLRRFLEDVPIQARRAGVVERGWRWCRRNPGIAATSTAAVTALVVGLGMALWQWQRAEESAWRAEDNAERAQTSAAQATKDFQLAFHAVEQMLERVGGNRLVAVPHMDRTRRAILQDAVHLYRNLLRGKESHPEVRLALARAHAHLGRVHFLLDQLDEAVQQQNEALALLQDLDDSPDVERRRVTATIYLDRGRAKGRVQQSEGAEADYRQALAAWEALAAERPDDPEFAAGKAYSLFLLGELLRLTARPAEAEPLLRQTIAVADALPATYVERSRLLSAGLNGLSRLLVANGHLAQAEAAFRRALDIRERNAREHPEPSNRHELGVMLYHVAELRAGDPKGVAEAERLYRRSIEIAERLVADYPDVATYRNALAEATNYFGLLLSRRGRAKDAEAMLERSVAVCKERVARSPGAAGYRVELGAVLNNLALERRDRGDSASARTLLEEAIGHQETVLKTHPSDAQALDFLNKHHGGLAELLLKSGKPEDAEKTLARQRATAQHLKESQPQSPVIRVFQASADETLAQIRRSAKRFDEAVAAYGDAAKLWRALHAEFPANPAYASQLGAVLNNWSLVYRTQQRWADMVPLLDEAIQFQEKAVRSRPEERLYQQYLYNHYTLRGGAGLSLGDHAHVTAAAKTLRKRLPEQFDDYFWAVRVARCIPLAKKDADLLPEQRDRLIGQYAVETMSLLRSAQQKQSKNLPQVHTNPAFQALRGRADFQALLGAVAKPAKTKK